MKLRKRWLAGAVLIFFVFFIAYLPAGQVVNRITLPDSVALGEVSGTIWSGRAQYLVVEGLTVINVRWEVEAWALLIGQLRANVKGGNLRQADEIAFSGPISVSLLNQENVQAEDFLLFLPVERVLAEIALPLPVNAGGRFRLQLDELVYHEQCQRLEGSGDWLNATVAGTQGPIDFGSYNARLNCNEGRITVQVNEPNKLGLSLEATIGENFNNVDVAGQFKPDPALPKEVHQAALFFGQPDTNGYTRFSL